MKCWDKKSTDINWQGINYCTTIHILSSLSLSLHSLQLGLLLRILDWYACVDILWSWAASIKLSVSPFKLEQLSHWWVVALSTSALSGLKRYFPCSGLSLHPFFMSSKLVFLRFFFHIFSCFYWFSIGINFFLRHIKLKLGLPAFFYHWVKFLLLFML